MNPMIAALQKSRSEGPSAPPTGGPAIPPEAAPEGAGPGGALIEKLAGVDAKLDHILKLLGAEQKEDVAEENDGTEATPNDDG